ncbi:MAG: hypothetical protein Q9165_001024 [Trypethelium subeluteriae]
MASQRKILVPRSVRPRTAGQPSQEPIIEEPTIGQMMEGPVDPDSNPRLAQAFDAQMEQAFDEWHPEEAESSTEESGVEPLAETTEDQSAAELGGQATQLQSEEDLDQWFKNRMKDMESSSAETQWLQSQDEPVDNQPEDTRLDPLPPQQLIEVSQEEIEYLLGQRESLPTGLATATEVEQQPGEQLAQDSGQQDQAAEELVRARLDLDGRSGTRVLGIEVDIRQYEAQIPEEVRFRILQLAKERGLLHTNVAKLRQQIVAMKAEEEAKKEADSAEQERFLEREEELERQLAERDEEIAKLREAAGVRQVATLSIREELKETKAELQKRIRSLQEDLARGQAELQQMSSSKAKESEMLRDELTSARAALEEARRLRDDQAREQSQEQAREAAEAAHQAQLLRDEVSNLQETLRRAKPSPAADARRAKLTIEQRATIKKLEGDVQQLVADRDGRPPTEVEALRAFGARQEAMKLSLAQRNGDLTKQVRKLGGTVEVLTDGEREQRDRLEREQQHSRGQARDLEAAVRKIEALQRALHDMRLRLSSAAPSLVVAAASAAAAAETGEVARSRPRARVPPPPPCARIEVWSGRERTPERVQRGRQRVRERKQAVMAEMAEKEARERDWEEEFARRTGWKCPPVRAY